MLGADRVCVCGSHGQMMMVEGSGNWEFLGVLNRFFERIVYMGFRMIVTWVDIWIGKRGLWKK